MKIYRLLQSLRNNITSRVHVNPVPKTNVVSNAVKTETCGLSLKPLEQDVLEHTSNVKTVSPTIEAKSVIDTAPAVFEGSAVPMHHYLHGANTNVRDAYEKAVGIEPIRDKDDLVFVKNMLQYMLKINKEFAKLPPLEKECIVWRGRIENPYIKSWNRDFEIIDNAKIGDIIIPDVGYSYTAFYKELAECFASSCGGRTMMIKWILPKGLQCSRNLEHGGELITSLALPAELHSKITVGNHTEVVLKSILPTKDNVAEIEELIRKMDSIML